MPRRGRLRGTAGAVWRLLLAVQVFAIVALPMLWLAVLIDGPVLRSTPIEPLGWSLVYSVVAIFWLWVLATPVLVVLLLLLGSLILVTRGSRGRCTSPVA